MSTFISAKEDCVHKEEFDYFMKNWKSIPDETLTCWSRLEGKEFREKLIAAMKIVVEDTKTPIQGEVPEKILLVLKDDGFHPITMLDTINKADKLIEGNKERVERLAKLLADYWMNSNHLTQILLSFTKVPNSTRKIANEKSYYGVVFTTGEKFMIDETKFIQFALTKLDTSLRVLVERDDARILQEVYTTSLVTFIERIFLRFCTRRYVNFIQPSEGYKWDNPFVNFMKSLMTLTKRNFRIQRMISGILIQLITPIQRKVLSAWFELALNTTETSTVPFFPVSNYLSHIGYKQTLLSILPFDVDAPSNTSRTFWINWANYVTSDTSLANMVWDRMIDQFWRIAAEVGIGDRIKTPAYAVAALAAAIKSKMPELKEVLHVLGLIDNLTKLIGSVDITIVNIGMALSHIVFDLARIEREVKTGKTFTPEFLFDCDASIYAELVGLYEGKNPEDVFTKPDGYVAQQPQPPESDEEDDGQEKYYECVDERVQRLRAAGLTPNSLKDVYHILLGETTGSNKPETEALKQVALLTIPILLCAGEISESEHIDLISKVLYEWNEHKILDEFIIIALFELGLAYPENMSKTLGTMVFSNNYALGEKLRMMKLTEKFLKYCGMNQCLCCFSIYGAYKKDDMEKFIRGILPAFFPKYVYRNRRQALCFNCPSTRDEKFPESDESIERRVVRQSRQISNPQASTSNSLPSTKEEGMEQTEESLPFPTLVIARGPPPTRRWGTRRKLNMEVIASKKEALHTSLWSIFNHLLLVESEKYLSQTAIIDCVPVYFLISAFGFLQLILLTYTGLGYFVQNVPKEALQLITIYSTHPNSILRQELWLILKELVNNNQISEELSIVDEPEFNSFFTRSLMNERNDNIRTLIYEIRKIYRSKKQNKVLFNPSPS